MSARCWQILATFLIAAAIAETAQAAGGLSHTNGDLDISVNGAERMRIITNGNVGIGTTSPSLGLEVQKDNGNGFSAVFRTSSTAKWLAIGTNSGTGSPMVQGLTANGLNGTDILLNPNSGNVGIGTTAPGSLLDVQQNSTLGSGNAILLNSLLRASPGSASTANYYAGTFTASAETANVGGAITATQNVAQNNSAFALPAAYGAVNFTNMLNVAGSITAAIGASNRVYNNRASGTAITNALAAENIVYNNAGATITNAYGSNNVAQNASTGAITQAVGTQSFINNSSTGTIGTAFSEYMAYNNTGTITNWYGLYVSPIAGTAPVMARYPIYVADNGPSYFAGRVGIGTTSPGALLQLGSLTNTVDSKAIFAAGNGTQQRAWSIRVPYGNATTSDPNYGLVFRDEDGAVDRMMISYNTGNVGIGTTAPAATALLDVTSTTKGVLMPRMTTTQRDAISSPATGLEIYNTTTNAPNYYNGTAWTAVGSGSSSGATTMSTNFPDAILCGYSGADTTPMTMYLADVNGGGVGRRYYYYPGSSSFYMIFANDGSYYSSGSMTSTGSYACISKSITQLYSTNQAFNFLGNNGVTTFNAGTAAAPGLGVTSNTTTGLFQPASNVLGFSTNGTERARIDASGNVGIGTTSPAYPLHVETINTATTGNPQALFVQMTATPGSSSTASYFGGNFSAFSISANIANSGLFGTQGTATNNGTGTLNSAYGIVGNANNAGSGVITTAFGGSNRVYNSRASGTGISTAIGGENYVGNNAAGTITNSYGVTANVSNNSTGTITGATSVNSTVTNSSTGTITSAYNGAFGISNASTGTLTTAVNLSLTYNNSGTATSWYGLLIPAITGTAPTTNRFPLYIADTGLSYFAGQVGIGTTTPAYKLDVVSTSSAIRGSTSDTTNLQYGVLGYGNSYYAGIGRNDGYSIVGNGSAYMATGSYQGSDERLKEHIRAIPEGLAVIGKLNPVLFKWRENTDQFRQTKDDNQPGLIAQEVQKVVPEVVNSIKLGKTGSGNLPAAPGAKAGEETLNEKLGTTYGVDYAKLVPFLIKAVQELKAENDDLQHRVDELEAKRVPTSH